MTSILSNITLSNGEYIVSASNPYGTLTINQPTTQCYLFSYGVNVLPSRIHIFNVSIGDTTSNITVALNGSNMVVSNATSNLFNNFIPSSYLISGYNSIFINRIEGKLIVGINGSNILRISNSNVLPQTYNNSTVSITASNNTKFSSISLSPTAVTNVPMNFTQPIKATSITCSNVSSCNLDILTSNISIASNVAYYSSNYLVKRTGDTMTGIFQVSMCNANLLLGSTSNAGSFVSLNQGLAMYMASSNYPFYGIGMNDGGKMNIQSYYGVTIGDKNTTAISIKNGNVGIGVLTPSVMLDVAGVVNSAGYTGATITSLSNLGMYGSNTSVWSSNASVSLCNDVANFSNSFIGLSNNFSTLSNSFSSFSNSQISFLTSTNSSISFLSNAQLTATSNFNTLSNYTYNNVTSSASTVTALSNYSYGMNTSNTTNNIWSSNTAIYGSNSSVALSNYSYGMTTSNTSRMNWNSNTALYASNASIALSNYSYGMNTSNITNNNWSSNTAIYGSNASVSLSNYAYGINGSNTLRISWNSNTSIFGSNTAISLSNNVSAIASSLSNTSNSLVAFSNYETSKINALSNYTYNLSDPTSTVTNVYTSNIVSSSGGTIGSLIMSSAGFALGGYNLLNNSGFLTSALKDATGLKINVDPSSGSMSALSLLGKFGQFQDSLMVGVSTLELSNNKIFFKDGATSNTIYSSNAITVLNSALTNFTISNANIVTNCNIVSPTITTLSNIAYYASNNLLSKSGGVVTNFLQVTSCNSGNVYLGSTNSNGSFLSLNQGATMKSSNQNFPVYGLGCDNTGKVNLQGYYGLSFGDGINNTMEIWNNCLGLGLSNPTTKLDVAGTINATAYTGSTITALSNLGLFGSNTSVFSSNAVISLSNQVFGSTASSIVTSQSTATFSSNASVFSSNSSVYSSNASVFGSNTAVSASNKAISNSNQLYGTTTTNISAAQVTANFGSNTSVFSSNYSVSASNTAVWSSNNLLNKAGGNISGFLGVSACNGYAYISSSSNGGSYLSLAQGNNMFSVASNHPYYGLGCSEFGHVNLQGYGKVTMGDHNYTNIILSGGLTTIQAPTGVNTDPILNVIHTNYTQGIGIGWNSITASGSNTNQDINIIPKGTGILAISSTITSPTVTSLSNLGMYNSNTSGYSSNTTVSLSNYIYTTSTTNISSVQAAATFSSNASVFGSNIGVWGSNSLISFSNNAYTNMTSIVNLISSQSNSVYTNLVSKSGGTMTGALTASSNIYLNDNGRIGFRGSVTSGCNDCIGYSNNALWLSGSNGVNFGRYANNSNVVEMKLELGRLGLATQTPRARIDAPGGACIFGDVWIEDNHLYLRGFGDNNHYVGYNSGVDGPELIGVTGGKLGTTAGSNTLYWNNNGYVGIGKSNPTCVLDVKGKTILTNTLIGDIGYGAFYAGFTHSNFTSTYATDYALLQDTAGTTFINCKSNNQVKIRENNTDTMVVGGSKVGIGTSSPSYMLDVNGTMRANNYVLPTGAWITSADNKNRIYYGSNDRTYYGSYNGHEFRSSTDANIMTLTNAGNMGLGTASPSQKLDVVGTIATQKINVGSGTTYSKMQSIILDGVTSSVRKLEYTMDGTYPSSYDLFIQPVTNSTTQNDTFATTVMVQSSTQIKIIICRVDESSGWSNPVTLHLLLLSKD